MLRRPSYVSLLLVLTVACGGNQEGVERTSSDGVELEIRLDESLRNDLEIVSKTVSRAGANSVDVLIEVKNQSRAEFGLHVTARFLDSSGQFRGGQESNERLLPGVVTRLSSGTRSKDAVRAELVLSPATDEPIVAAKPPPPADPTVPCAPDPIPAAPISGWVAGRWFIAQTVLFVHDLRDDSWRVEVWDKKMEKPMDLATYDGERQVLRIDLEHEPSVNSELTHPFGPGNGFFQVRPPEWDTTTSWNSRNASAVLVSGWEIRAAVDGELQRIGTASGSVTACYRGSGGIPDSSVAGNFRDAIVLSLGD